MDYTQDMFEGNDDRKWTKEAFQEFHKAHPEIYERFCRFAQQAAAKRPYFSARAIFHRMRWETMIDEGGEFKIDDGWSSHYARKFMDEHPQYGEFFQKRARKGGYHEDASPPPLRARH